MNNTALRMKLETRNQKPTSARFCVKRSMLALACAGLFAVAADAAPTGVTVNGTALDDAVPSSGTGWSYAAPTLTLSGAGPFTLSGTNESGKVRVVAANATCTVTLSSLTLVVSGSNQCAFALGENVNVSLSLRGANSLASGMLRAGLEVAAGRTLSITNAPGDAAGALTATGGHRCAGIGGGSYGNGGTVVINGGTVAATGGYGGAGIGSGTRYGSMEAIHGGTVTVHGGTVTVEGLGGGAGIGGGDGGNGGTLTVSGGTVTANGGEYGADIGPGHNGTGSGANTFTGGSIRLADNSIAPAPSNGTARVWCVTVPDLTPGAPIAVTDLDPYGVTGLVAGENGKLYLWLPNGIYNFTADGEDYLANVADKDVRAVVPPPTYITFSSAEAFTVTVPSKSWTSKLYSSTNKTDWHEITAAGAIPAAGADGEFRLHFRGTGNRKITGSRTATPWSIAATRPVACSGNIETLLDYAQVAYGEHPPMDAYCLALLFKNCAALTTAPSLPATNLADNCYFCMFEGTGLTTAPALPATTLAPSCYDGMFCFCTSLMNAPTLPATTLALNCYGYMFYGCTSLMSVPELPATTLADSCYQRMFKNCAGIKLYTTSPGTAWNIPAGAANPPGWNAGMFEGTSGTFTGNPARGTTYYYVRMPAPGSGAYLAFSSAASFTITPQMAIWNGRLYCSTNTTTWQEFTEAGATSGRIGLWNHKLYICGVGNSRVSGSAPTLTRPWQIAASQTVGCSGNIETLLDHAKATGGLHPPMIAYCFASLFEGCAKLRSAPELPATTLVSGCYSAMFKDCTGLTRVPVLAATNLADNCYSAMFQGCTGIKLKTAGPGAPWSIPSGATGAMGWNNSMFANTGGAFTGNPAIGTVYYHAPPSSPPEENPYITFSSKKPFTITPQQPSWNGMLYTSTDTTNWVEFTTAGATAGAVGIWNYKLYICGAGNTRIAGDYLNRWTLDASGSVACSGNIETLLDHAVVGDGGHPKMERYCFANLFAVATALGSAPTLPATTLAPSCYSAMFTGCTGLKQAPALPATTLALACYSFMFHGCTGLTQAPELPAANLVAKCYDRMFGGCTGLTRAPELPATTLAEECYQYMFLGCTGLTRLPALSAKRLADRCYYQMFDGCTGIVLNAEGPGMSWSIPGGATPATRWNSVMLTGTSGSFTDDPQIGTTYYLASGLPATPALATDGTGFVIGDGTATLTIINAEAGLWYTVYSANDLDGTWTPLPNQSILATGSHVVFTFDIDTTTVPRRFFKVMPGITAP